MSPQPSGSKNERIPVACPACGEVYHVRPDTPTWQCKGGSTGRCRRKFDVQAALAATKSPGGEGTTEAPRHGEAAAEWPTGISQTLELPTDLVRAVPLDEDLPIIPMESALPSSSPAAPSQADIVAQPLGDYEPPPRQLPVSQPGQDSDKHDSASKASRWKESRKADWGEDSAEKPAAHRVRRTQYPVPSSPTSQSAAAGRPESAPRRSGNRAAKDKADKHSQRRRPIKRLMTAALLLFAATAFACWWFYPRANPDAEWQAAQQVYQNKQWTAAKKNFRDFAEEFPEAPQAGQVPFFLDLCEAGDDIYSNTGDIDRGWSELQRIFQTYRDQPVYNDYRADLYFAAKQLAAKFLDRAEAALKPADVQLARDAHRLQATIAESMTDSFVPEQMQEIAARLETVDQAVKLELARREAKVNLELAQSLEFGVDVDAIYARDASLLRQYPELAGDVELQPLREAAYRAEAKRVRFRPEGSPANVVPAAAPAVRPVALHQPPVPLAAEQENKNKEKASADTIVVWGESQPAVVRGGGPREVFTALARGVLYAFDSRGTCLWSVRLGIDSLEPPVFVPATATNPDLFIAVSTLENALLALDPATGRVRWRYRPGDEHLLSTLPTIVAVDEAGQGLAIQRILLPAGKEIHVLEPVLGRRMGRYEVGFPMTAPGVFDARTGLVYFPSDSRRVFALDPRVIDDSATPRPACPSMLFTEHASGAMRNAPSVVGPYLIVAEASDLSRMKLRTFLLHRPADDDPSAAAPPAAAAADNRRPAGFVDPRSEPAKEIAMSGWSWFQPSATPDRIAIVTDEGELGVFGLNLDNTQESLYPLILDEQEQTTRLTIRDPFRSLAVYSEEHLLWVMAGGKLQRFFLDVIGQQVKPLALAGPRAAAISGVPVHAAQLDRAGNTFFLATMSLRGDDFAFSAVDVDTGDLRWQRHLGVNLAGDPLVMPRGILLLDRSGRLLGLSGKGSSPSNLTRILQRPRDNELPRGVPAADVIRVPAPDGGFFLVAAVERGQKLAIRLFNEQAVSTENWRLLTLPAVLRGRPALHGATALVPCADGMLHTLRISAAGLKDAVLPFALNSSGDVRVYFRDEKSVLIVAGRTLRRLALQDEGGVVRWNERGPPVFCRRPIVGEPKTFGDRLLLVDDGGWLYRVPADGQELTVIEPARVAGKVTREPFVRGGRLFVVEDDRRLHCIDPQAAELSRPLWTSAAFAGRICGEPPLLGGDRLLVADTSGRLSALQLADGQPAWTMPLGVDVGPTAAAVPLSANRILVPLADGTLIEVTPPRDAEPRVARSAE